MLFNNNFSFTNILTRYSQVEQELSTQVLFKMFSKQDFQFHKMSNEETNNLNKMFVNHN